MDKILSIEELQNNTEDYLGKQIVIEAFMSSNFEEAFLSISSENSMGLKIFLDEGITNRLMKYIPAWGGGKYVYYDDVEIAGTLVREKQKVFLVGISYVKTKRKNQTYLAILQENTL